MFKGDLLKCFTRLTIRAKQGCPLSVTLFGIHIDEITDFIDCEAEE